MIALDICQWRLICSQLTTSLKQWNYFRRKRLLLQSTANFRMKNLFFLFYFSLLFSSCSVKLPKSYSEKSFKEENYLENHRNEYTLHFDKNKISEINLQNTSDLFRWNKTDDPILLKNYKTRPYFNLISKNDTITISNRHIDFKNVINLFLLSNFQFVE